MKKNIFSLMIALATITVSASANPVVDIATPTSVVGKQLLASFQNDFANATIISWDKTENYAKATFMLNGEVMYAFYNEAKGELIATTRNLNLKELSLNLQAAVKEELKTKWITDLFELSNNDGTSYYLAVENDKERKVYKSEGLNGWTVYSVTAKH